jgi:predicted dehydrogenase
MILTDELKDTGRRNFLKVLAGTPALAALGAGAMTVGPVSGGPVKAAIIGTGGEGQVLLNQCAKEFIDIRALCDINPVRRKKAADIVTKMGAAQPKEYDDYKEMLEREDIEAVIIATPLWSHAEITVGCLDKGKHVLCEKMMAKDMDQCQQMINAAKRNNRLLEIGYQRFYNPIYQAAYENIIKQGVLGDIYMAKLVWHRNSSWRRTEAAPAPDYNPSRWGYSDWEHLLNWRLYRKHSEGLMAELGSHQIAVTDWFFDSVPEKIYASGGTYRYKDGREVYDHIYATLDYPGGRTATFSSIQSNELEGSYEQFMGTKGTLILRGESEAYLFGEEDSKATTIEVTKQQGTAPVADASASRVADASTGRTVGNTAGQALDKLIAYKNEISEFCSAIRVGTPLRCGPEQAIKSAVACVMVNEAAEKRAQLEFPRNIA